MLGTTNIKFKTSVYNYLKRTR